MQFLAKKHRRTVGRSRLRTTARVASPTEYLHQSPKSNKDQRQATSKAILLAGSSYRIALISHKQARQSSSPRPIATSFHQVSIAITEHTFTHSQHACLEVPRTAIRLFAHDSSHSIPRRSFPCHALQ